VRGYGIDVRRFKSPERRTMLESVRDLPRELVRDTATAVNSQ